MRICKKENSNYVDQRILHKESIQGRSSGCAKFGERRTPREGKTDDVGETIRERDGEKHARHFEVIERTIDRDGNASPFPRDIQVHTWWTKPHQA